MSRFVAANANGQEFAYGFDRPLGEYFIQLLDGEDDATDLCGFPVNNGTNGNFLEVVSQYGIQIPDEHLDNVCLDLPI